LGVVPIVIIISQQLEPFAGVPNPSICRFRFRVLGRYVGRHDVLSLFDGPVTRRVG
jgi:hypothetical protein